MKKKLLMGIGILLTIGFIGNLMGGSEEQAEVQPNTVEVAETVEQKETAIDPATMELTPENIKAIAQPILPNAEDINVTIENGDVTISYYMPTIISAKSEVKENAKKTVKILTELYKNPNVGEVWISELADVMDDKGNESRDQIIGFNTDRAKVQDVNWENMYSMVSGDYKNIQNIAVGYIQSRAIQGELNE